MSDLQLFFGGGNFEFAAPITIQTTDAGNKEWIHDNITRTSNTPESCCRITNTQRRYSCSNFYSRYWYNDRCLYNEGVTVTKGHVTADKY